jgi:poly-gamma-glutamate capsule biosynthesis protein CapA/YwtB (metallophosphatase superfamily)
MVQAASLQQQSFIEAARNGNLRAIAAWVNQALQPYQLRARVGSGQRPGLFRLLIELPPELLDDQPAEDWREPLIRFICHQLWQLNSPVLSGVSIAACLANQPKREILWRQSVRIVTPANRDRRQPSQKRRRQPQQLHSQIRRTSRQKNRLKATRTLLVGAPAIAAIVVGGVLGYSRAPVGQNEASASRSGDDNLSQRPDTVKAVLETVPVIKHNDVTNPHDPNVTLMFGGDVTLADHFAEVMGKDYAKAFAAMPEYKQADLAMVNLENPLTRATIPMPDKQFNFKADPEAVQVLKDGGVSIVNVANNHTMDYEADGLKETLSTLDSAGIQYVGAGKDLTEARRPKIIDVKGQRIAFLSYWGDEYGAEANKPGINSIKEERIAEDIHAIRDQVDWVVVNFHWGQELAEAPADWQVKLGRFTVDQGADMVVGHHPHVLQGTEVYKGRPIAYSLGNFIFGGNPNTDYDTAVMKVSLKDKQMKVEMLPVKVQAYQPKVAEGEQGKQILDQVTQRSAIFPQPMQPSMVLDARTPNTPSAAPAPDAGSPATSPSPSLSPSPNLSPSPDASAPSAPPTPFASPIPFTSPSPSPTSSPTELSPDSATPLPNDLEPPLPGAPGDNNKANEQKTDKKTSPDLPTFKGTEPIVPAPNAAPNGAGQSNTPTLPSAPDNSAPLPPTPIPQDPNHVDILPGYGEVAPPMSPPPMSAPTSPPPMNSAPGTEYQTPSNNTLSPADPTIANPNAPQLPSLGSPSSTDPTQSPMKINQINPPLSPDAMKPEAMKPDAIKQPDDTAIARAKVSFEIKPVAQNADKDPETTHNKHNVALAAPAMW